MPWAPLPPDAEEFLRLPNPAVIATVRPDGELLTVATWYEYLGDGAIMVNMAATRKRLEYMRKDPRVSLTVLDKDDWYRHVSVIGRVAEIRRDPDLADVDRLAIRYTGQPYRDRTRDSWTAIIDVVQWHGWIAGTPMNASV
jgi:PPOX class probable F420-dependent enzyme